MRGTRVAFFLPSLGKGGAEKVASVIVSTLCKHYDIYFVLQNGEQVYATPDKIPVITLRKFSSLKILNLILSNIFATNSTSSLFGIVSNSMVENSELKTFLKPFL